MDEPGRVAAPGEPSATGHTVRAVAVWTLWPRPAVQVGVPQRDSWFSAMRGTTRSPAR
jgi:hypothetical protein